MTAAPDPRDDRATDDGLRSVFGERHVLVDLRTTTEQLSPAISMSVTPLDDPLRDPTGRPSLGLLATLADVNASLVALAAAQPDWTATVSLTLHSTALPASTARVEGPIVAVARLERAGSKIVVVHLEVRDGGGRTADAILDTARADSDQELDPADHIGPVVAAGVATFTRIPASASRVAGRFDVAAMIGRRRSPTDDPIGASSTTRPLRERVGWRVVDPTAGIVEVDATPYVRNSFGAITGGVHAMVIEAASVAATDGDREATGIELHYLAQARSGTVRTHMERLRADRTQVRLVSDTGVTVTLGIVTLGMSAGT